jgi:hypothetical protein
MGQAGMGRSGTGWVGTGLVGDWSVRDGSVGDGSVGNGLVAKKVAVLLTGLHTIVIYPGNLQNILISSFFSCRFSK